MNETNIWCRIKNGLKEAWKCRERNGVTVHAWEMMMKWKKKNEEIMMEKCVMKMKCMGNGLRDWSWHKNGWEMKRNWLEIEEGGSRFWEREEEQVQKTHERGRRSNLEQNRRARIRLAGFPNRLAGYWAETWRTENGLPDLRSGWPDMNPRATSKNSACRICDPVGRILAREWEAWIRLVGLLKRLASFET